MARRMDIKDWIPARGEAEVGMKLKGSYGGKMRSRGFRRRKAWTNNNPQVLWSNALTELETSGTDGLRWMNYVMKYGNLVTPTHFTAVRVMTVNPNTPTLALGGEPQVEDEQAQLNVHRVIFDATIYPAVTSLRVNGNLLTATEVQRDDIPMYPGQTTGNTGLNGYLLNGSLADGVTGFGSQSWFEGQPLNWALMYEEYAQATEALDASSAGNPSNAFDPTSAAEWSKNRRIFRQGTLVTSVHQPVRLKFDKRFPGRGLQLTYGDRQIYQLTLAIWGYRSGTTIPTAFNLAIGEMRFQYKRP